MRQRYLLALGGVVALIVGGVFFRERWADSEAVEEARSAPIAQHIQSVDQESTSAISALNRAQAAATSDDFFHNGVSFDTMKSSAEQGDALAQRLLSEMYEDCLPYSLDSDGYFATLDQTVQRVPAAKMPIVRIKEQTRQFCDTVDGGQPIPYEAYASWLQQSAASGDLVAQIKQRSRSPKAFDADEFKRYLEKALRADDRQALFELSNVVGDPFGGTSDDEERADLAYAWAIVACRRGAECGPSSRLMRQVCLGYYRCQYRNYEHFLLSEMVPVARRAGIERMVVMLNAALGAP